MARPRNIAKLVKSLKLTEAEKQTVRDLLKTDPKVEKLKQQHADLSERLRAVEAEIAEVMSEPAKAKPGRKGKAVSVKSGRKPRRKAKADKPDTIEGDAVAPKRRGSKPGTKATGTVDTKRAAMLERMAKMRAARAAKAAAE